MIGLSEKLILSVLGDSKEETGKETIIEAFSVCPVNALLVFDEGGKQIVPWVVGATLRVASTVLFLFQQNLISIALTKEYQFFSCCETSGC